jgi:hypothetical protein
MLPRPATVRSVDGDVLVIVDEEPGDDQNTGNAEGPRDKIFHRILLPACVPGDSPEARDGPFRGG